MDDSKVAGGKVKKPGKRGRKPAKIDLKAKLERSRQSARECRARKKLRYQYLEELVSSRERAICALREELEMGEGGRAKIKVPILYYQHCFVVFMLSFPSTMMCGSAAAAKNLIVEVNYQNNPMASQQN
ncbi:cAMP-responsive element-binding protein-like 2 isoform X1 [Podarcis raffonei]|uniref:cAMP-responsive element-binding protein-like 2 isoform X1 n=1 Tax=Podarcis raffonei TaxID=65483 RepID=UPI002329367B|nr:cAMP-responsive element-binding protein-like 2 isoform X1 [Podarcis raffonei]